MAQEEATPLDQAMDGLFEQFNSGEGEEFAGIEAEVEEESVEDESEEISEEDSEEGEDEGDETESEDSDESEEEPDEEEPDEEELSVINENLNKALHAEREKRKRMAEMAQTNEGRAAQAETRASVIEEAFTKLKEEIKSLDMEDIISIPEVDELTPEAAQKRQEEAAKQNQEMIESFYKEAREEANSQVADFKHIDSTNQEQGEILHYLVTALALAGNDTPTAVKTAMGYLDKVIGATAERARKTRQPVAKPKSKPKARTKKNTNSSFDSKVKSGDLDGAFNDIAKRLAGQ